MKCCTGNRRAVVLFVIVQAILYVTFLTLDLCDKHITLSNWIKFSVIILCFCYVLFYAKSSDKSIFFLPSIMKLAMLFTVISDLFLLILDHYFFGVITFIVVQQLYAVRIILAEAERRANMSSYLLGQFLTRIMIQSIITGIICMLLMRYDIKLEPLLVVSTIYFISILMNVLFAVRATARNLEDKNMLFFTIGMGLFLLCDINVGLFNLTGFISLPKVIDQHIYSLSSILMWAFYAPSQAMIALSTSITSNIDKD